MLWYATFSFFFHMEDSISSPLIQSLPIEKKKKKKTILLKHVMVLISVGGSEGVFFFLFGSMGVFWDVGSCCFRRLRSGVFLKILGLLGLGGLGHVGSN